MKQYCALLFSVVLSVGILASCVPSQSDLGINKFTTAASTTPTTTGENMYTVSLPGLADAARSGEFEYVGNAIEQECRLNLSRDTKASMLFFTDGYLQPYSVNGGEYDYIHFLPSGTYTLSFHPVSGSVGESVQFVTSALLQSEFEKVNGGYYYFQEQHFLGMTGAYNLVMKANAPSEVPQVASNLTYIKELEGIFRDVAGVGDGSTENMGYASFRVYDKDVQANEDGTYGEAEYRLLNTLTAEKNTEHEVFISGYGKTGRYRVSLFINNELQYAFDGKPYLDMEIVAENMTTCSVKINTANLNEDNYIYLVYYPLDIDTEDMMMHRVGSTTPCVFYVN